MKFKVGDRVKYNGYTGSVCSIRVSLASKSIVIDVTWDQRLGTIYSYPETLLEHINCPNSLMKALV